MTEPSQPDVETTGTDGLEEISGKVVDFLSTREVIMSVGKKDGVQIGMRFVIIGHEPVEYGEGDDKITGTVEVPKSVVKVVRLSGDQLSIGRTFRVIKGRPAHEVDNPLYNKMLSNPALGRIAELSAPKIKFDAIPDRLETFDVDKKDTVRGRADMTVKKGDTVRLTTGDEFL